MGCEFPQVPIRELIADGLAKLQTGPFGSQLHKHEYVDVGVGVPVIPTEAIGRGRIRADVVLPHVSVEKANELHRHRLQEGDILFARRGIQATGLSACIDSDHVGSLCGTGALLLRVDRTSIHPRFLSAFLATGAAFDWLRSHAVGAVMPNLNTEIISNLAIPFLPLQTQRDIGDFVAALDDRIDLLRQTNTTLEAIAQALFKSWFVDFDPVHANAEAQAHQDGARSGQPSKPHAANLSRPHAAAEASAQDGPETAAPRSTSDAAGSMPAAHMDAATAALFPSEFEASELGLIPKGWPVKSFGDCVTILGGGTPKTSIPEYWGGDIPWFSVVDAPATGQVFTLDTAKKITPLGLDNCSAKLFPPMTTIISARGTVGKVALTASEMAMNQSCYGLRSTAAGGEAFVYFSTLRFVDHLQQIAHGAVFDTITRSSFDQVSACRPADSVIARFGALAEPLLERIRMNGYQATSLEALRDTLLPRLISGKLRLPDAEHEIEVTP